VVEAQPELLAFHCSEAGLLAEAIAYWERAGRRAAERSANKEATGHFRKALELVGQTAESAERDQRELNLLIALGPALMATTTSVVHHYCEAVRPSPAHRYFRPRGWSRLCLFPYHRRPGSPVPYRSPVELRAAYRPDAARTVSGHPPS
jgi:hypothetical protein